MVEVLFVMVRVYVAVCYVLGVVVDGKRGVVVFVCMSMACVAEIVMLSAIDFL